VTDILQAFLQTQREHCFALMRIHLNLQISYFSGYWDVIVTN